MAEATAAAQLARIMEILPEAARDEGVSLAELSARMETDQKVILRDLQDVVTRAYYHPAGGGGDGVQVTIEPEHVQVWTTGDFQRPVRLSASETLALDLGLRILAAESPDPDRSGLLRLADDLVSRIAAPGAKSGDVPVAVGGATGSPEAGAVLQDAARTRRRCEIDYVKPGADEPRRRTIDPYAILIAEAGTYVIAHCGTTGGIRVFRQDRIAEARLTDESFEVPADFDPKDYVEDGRVFQSDDPAEVVIRYDRTIARWVREREAVEEMPDGSVIARYALADPSWAVRHALRHGSAAEVLEPVAVRELVAAAAERMAG